ncbi:MAG: hypothetical protein C5B50_11965 [Verrucomicrobia bacterium]|nr:MAG: hypothetical protein C5B50_11965 [Verrucomicrobiota bacterium]
MNPLNFVSNWTQFFRTRPFLLTIVNIFSLSGEWGAFCSETDFNEAKPARCPENESAGMPRTPNAP